MYYFQYSVWISIDEPVCEMECELVKPGEYDPNTCLCSHLRVEHAVVQHQHNSRNFKQVDNSTNSN